MARVYEQLDYDSESPVIWLNDVCAASIAFAYRNPEESVVKSLLVATRFMKVMRAGCPTRRHCTNRIYAFYSPYVYLSMQ